MYAEYIPLIVLASQIAQRTIERITSKNDTKRRVLTKHYRRHSEQLVTALVQWGRQINFSMCEYREGELLTQHPREVNQPTIPYLEDVMKHVEKSYEFVLKTYRCIDSRHKELCKQINQVMSQGISVIPYEPSYESIKLGNIKQKCPGLRRTDKESLRENNIFLASYVFNLIFEKVSSEKSETKLFVERTSDSNIHRLTDNARVFGQGSLQEMTNLKKAIEELILDSKIRSRVREYHNLYTLLTNDKHIGELLEIVQRIHDLIYGGKFLGGFLACDLCEPDYNII
jgi:hypothetical protein